MAIKTIQNSEFPPAHLFLDDIEEIISIFQRLAAKDNDGRESSGTTITYSIGNQCCDDVRDLPRIGKSGHDIEITFLYGRTLFWLNLGTRFGSSVTSSGEEERLAHDMIMSIFIKRKTTWRNILHTVPDWCWWILGFVGIPLLFKPFEKVLQTLPFLEKFPFSLLLLVSIFFAGALFASVFLFPPHTTVAFRYSWEPAPLVQYFKDKIIPIVASALLGIAATLLGIYVKHKFWP